MRHPLLPTAVLLLGVLTWPLAADEPAGPEQRSAKQPAVRLSDEFSDRLALNWKIIREDRAHWSLTKNPGRLTITTQRGAIHGDSDQDEQSGGIRTKNMFFVANPVAPDQDFSMTLAVTKFEPTTFYHQFGLLCYDDDDNYLKWTYEYTWRKPGTTCFTLVRETNKVPVHDLVYDLPFPGKLWIRVIRRGPEYICSYSTDGRTFPVVGSRPWKSSGPKYLGFLAKNGGNADAPEIDVCIDSFELVSPAANEAPSCAVASDAALSGAASRADDKQPGGQDEVKIEVGAKAPSLCAHDGAGDVMLDTDYQGKTLLVFFWSLADPARDELIRQLKQVREEYANDERFRLLAVCVDSEFEKWSQFSRDEKLFRLSKWWHLLDCPDCEEQIHKHARFDTKATPALFLVGPNNRFLAVNVPPNKLRAGLEKHLPHDATGAAKP